MFDENDIQEVITLLNKKVDKMETEAEMMKLCCVLLRYAHGICDVFAEEDNEDKEETADDTDIG